MNFIASVLISITDSEDSAFLVLMHMLIELDMRPIFLPVSLFIYNWPFIGCARAAPKEFPNSITDKIPHASFFWSLTKSTNDDGLLHEQMVYDNFLLFSTVWVDWTYLRYVHIGRLAVSVQGRNRATPTTWTDFDKYGHDRDVLLFQGHRPPRAGGQALWTVSARL